MSSEILREFLVAPHPSERVETYVDRIGIPPELRETAIQQLLSTGDIPREILEMAASDKPVGMLMSKSVALNIADYSVRRHYKGRTPTPLTEIETALIPDPDVYKTPEAYAEATNLRPDVAKSIYNNELSPDVWANPEFIAGNISNPDKLGYANLYAKATGGTSQGWQSKVFKRLHPEKNWNRSYIEPALAVEFESYRRLANAKMLNPGELEERLAIAREEVQVGLESVFEKRAPGAAVAWGELTEEEVVELEAQEDLTRQFVGKALTEFRELNAERIFPELIGGFVEKTKPETVEKAIEAGQFLSDAQSSEGGEPTILVMVPKSNDNSPAYKGKQGDGTYHFEDFDLQLMPEKKVIQASIDGRVIKDNSRLRFTSFGADLETSDGRKEYNDQYGDKILGVPVYLPTPVLKSVAVVNGQTRAEEDRLNIPKSKPGLKEWYKANTEPEDWSLLLAGANLVGVPLRFMVGLTEAALDDNNDAWDIVKGGISNAFEMNPEKQTYFTTMFTNPDFLKSIGWFQQEDKQLARQIELLKLRPSSDSNQAEIARLEEEQERYKIRTERDNIIEFNRLTKLVDEAPDNASYERAQGDLNRFRESLYSLAGPMTVGILADCLFDPLFFVGALTEKSANVAARQFGNLGKKSARNLSRQSRGKFIEVIDAERGKLGLSPIKPLLPDERDLVTTGETIPVTARDAPPPAATVGEAFPPRELKSGAEQVGESVRRQVEEVSSPATEADEALQIRQEVFRPARDPRGRAEKPTTAWFSTLDEIDPLSISTWSPEARAARASNPTSEAGRVRKARQYLHQELVNYGERFNVPSEAVEAELARVDKVLVRAEKSGKIGKAGYQIQIPILSRYVQLNKNPSLEAPIRDFIEKNLPAIDKGLKALSDAGEKLGPLRHPLDWLALGTSRKKKAIVSAFEEARNEYMDAYISHNMLKYLDATKDADDATKRMALFRLFRDSEDGDAFLASPMGVKLSREWSKTTDHWKADQLADTIHGIIGDSPLGSKYYGVAEKTGYSLDAVIPTRLAESAQGKAKAALQQNIGDGFFAARLSGVRDPKEVLDEVFSKTVFEGGGGFYLPFTDAQQLGDTARPIADRLSKTYENYRQDIEAAPPPPAPTPVKATDAVDRSGEAWWYRTSIIKERHRDLDAVLDTLFQSSEKPTLTLDALEEVTSKNRGRPIHHFRGRAGKAPAVLPLDTPLSSVPQDIKITETADRALVQDILNMPEEDYKTLRAWFRQTDAGPDGNNPRNRAFPLTSADVPVATKRYMDSSISHQVSRLFPVLSGVEDAVEVASKYQKFTNWWKGIATVWNLGFHSRNAASGGFLYWLGGGKLDNIIPDYRNATYAMALDLSGSSLPKWANKPAVTLKTGEELSVAQVRALADKYGVVDSSYTISDLPSDFDQIIARAESLAGGGRSTGKSLGKRLMEPVATAKTVGKGVLKTPRNVGQFLEGQGRMSLFIASMRDGMSPTEAASHTKRLFFDYGALPKAIRKLKPHVPFITWASKNIGLQIEQFIANPGKYHNLLKIGRGFTELARQTYGDDWEHYVPEWLQGAAALAIPDEITPDEHPWLVRFDLPATTLTSVASFIRETSRTAQQGTSWGDAAFRVGRELKDEAIGMLNPILGGIAVVTGITDSVYDPFRGRALKRDRMVEAKGAAKDLFDVLEDLTPPGAESIRDMFGVTKEQIPGGYKYTYPETSAYIIQMLPPVVHMVNFWNDMGVMEEQDAQWFDKLMYGVVSNLPVKGVSIDKARQTLSHIYDIQRSYNDLQEHDSRYWRGDLVKDEGAEEKALPKKSFFKKRKPQD